jgi:hypothetical protein
MVTTAARIRAALKDAPLSRAELAAILGLTRPRLASQLDKQLRRGLLAEDERGIVLVRCSLREDLEDRARRLAARRARCNARRRVRRAAKAALRPVKTAEEREAARREYEARRNAKARALRAERNPPKPKLTAEQRLERNRERSRAWYQRESERLGRKARVVLTPEERESRCKARKRAANANRVRVSRIANRLERGPAIRASAKRIREDTQRIAQRCESVEEFMARHPERYEVLPGFMGVAAYSALPIRPERKGWRAA